MIFEPIYLEFGPAKAKAKQRRKTIVVRVPLIEVHLIGLGL